MNPDRVSLGSRVGTALRSGGPVVAARLWLILMFAATLRVTAPLWTAHVAPPMLPLAPWPRFDYFGELLLMTFALCLAFPRAALGVNVVVGLVAMTADQTRMQPQIFSLWLLMLGTWPQPTAKFLCRCHLAALWFFSGFHKLLSAGYFEDVAPWMFTGIFPAADWPWVAGHYRTMAAIVAWAELVLGVIVFVPRLRKVAATAAALLHLGILIALYRLDWNTSVWPWNAAVAVVGAWSIASWKETPAAELRRSGRLGFALGVALFLSPALYYVGLLDAYLSHCLYSQNVPQAVMYALDGPPYGRALNASDGIYWRSLNVPQPPTHRNFALYFRAVAQPGDYMVVTDSRACAAWYGEARYAWRYDGHLYDRVVLPPGPARP